MTDDDQMSDRMNALISFAEARDGRRYSTKYIAERATELGYRMSASNLSHIRVGRIKNPTFRAIEGVAAVLDVDLREFGALPRSTTADALEVSFRGVDVSELNELGREAIESVIRSVVRDLASRPEFRSRPLE
ncbi:hypothetical protein [Tsukamurella paurometabola]|uniref:HTH cro/C1-type domain-containing protein n=1 Tax=Tsukamurella paurometabola TaxID=2061 RepID=A0A3P8L1J3_TSUPA|nr:hypothetical protein [Tsukamurella paurometabola]MBS4103839.1 hypothetical protein [Tsukamurella paurometabola]UEA81451.1 hypothetical protein LK411_13645 [Tsukamurella paurometabola]VDR38445.1 Uncharacterised protein [Tsukamurella paurometabola]